MRRGTSGLLEVQGGAIAGGVHAAQPAMTRLCSCPSLQFLDALTPQEWVKDRIEDKKRRQEDRRVAGYERNLAEWEQLRDQAIADARAREEEARKRALKEGRKYKKTAEVTEADLDLPPRPQLDDEPLVSSGEEMPMYFTHPQQLLDIFTQLEEGNLFLIQNCQETEQQLEELKQTYRETERKMQKQTQALQDNIEVLKAQIDREQAKAAALADRVKESSGEDGQAQLLKMLRLKVKDVYKACGFEADANPDTLSMLTDLEVGSTTAAVVLCHRRALTLRDVMPGIAGGLVVGDCVDVALVCDAEGEGEGEAATGQASAGAVGAAATHLRAAPQEEHGAIPGASQEEAWQASHVPQRTAEEARTGEEAGHEGRPRSR